MRKVIIVAVIGCCFIYSIDCQAIERVSPFYEGSGAGVKLNYQDFIPDPYVKQGYWACSGAVICEPDVGYPYHSSLVAGVNDTLLMWIELKNFTSESKSLKAINPDSWFTPVLYKTYTDYKSDRVWLDANEFEYAFAFWSKFGEIPPPASLKPNGEVTLIFYVWDLPLGRGVIDIKKGSSAPTELTIKKIGPGQFWSVSPYDVRDSINAYLAISFRAMERKQLTAALAWTDSILAKEDSSLAGWEIRGMVYNELKNIPDAIDCFGRVASIYINNHDPLLDWQDTLRTTDDERAWASDRYNYSSYMFWKLSTGNNDPEE